MIKHQKWKVKALIVYVDDIVVTSYDQCAINNLKGFLGKEFVIKYVRLLKYLIGIEVARSKVVIFLS